MATFRSLLVPIDGSEPSEVALSLALTLAKEWGAHVTFCYVVDWFALSQEAVGAQMAGGAGSLIAEDEARGRSLVDAAQKRALSAALSAMGEVLSGAPAQTIIEYTKSHSIDLIVIGTHGRGGLVRLVLGSTAEGVLRHSTVPVLTVRP
jgi:nucleotide-binding universal stress UspA family protein